MIHGYLGTFGYYGSWYPNELQISQVCKAIDQFVSDERRVVWAVAVLPTHIHIAFGRGRTSSEDLIQRLKQYIQDHLENSAMLPADCGIEHSMWAVGQWIDYLDSEMEIDNAIYYTWDLRMPVFNDRQAFLSVDGLD